MSNIKAKRTGIVLLLLALALIGPAEAQKAPPMSRAEAAQLYTAGGFPIVGNRPTNGCGAPANPPITFVDMNGDKRPEALFIDKGICYLPDKAWFAIAAKDARGNWRQLVGQNGTIRMTPATANGWPVLTWTSNGKAQPMTYDGAYYVAGYQAAAATVPKILPKIAPQPGPKPAPKPAATGPYPTDGWTLPKTAASLTAADRATLYRAAGFVQRGKNWVTCENEHQAVMDDSMVDGGIIQDLNGDGRPEVFLMDSGSFCYGMVGVGFALMTPRPGGWTMLWTSPGNPTILKTRGIDNWPDIEAGGPGFCQPIYRWNGKIYDMVRRREEQKGGCSGR